MLTKTKFFKKEREIYLFCLTRELLWKRIGKLSIYLLDCQYHKRVCSELEKQVSIGRRFSMGHSCLRREALTDLSSGLSFQSSL